MSAESPISGSGAKRPPPQPPESPDIAQLLPWLHEASNPYWDWLWGSPAEALAQLKEWLDRPSSGLSEKRVVCLSEGGRVVGGYIALPGWEFHICRKSDLLELMINLRRNPREGVMARMRQARSLFGGVAEDEFYLSRVGVMPSERGRGVGRRLIEMFLQDGRDRDFKRFRLDVSADNDRAIRVYRTAGFVVAREAAIPGTPIHYCSMTASF